jgi:hypothetical protein
MVPGLNGATWLGRRSKRLNRPDRAPSPCSGIGLGSTAGELCRTALGWLRRRARGEIRATVKAAGIVGMHAGRLQGNRPMSSGWIIAAPVVLLTFGFCVLDLPVHLVHHLGDVNPDCQLLGLSISLNTSSLIDSHSLPGLDSPWDVLRLPVVLPSSTGFWERAQARAPPTVQP